MKFGKHIKRVAPPSTLNQYVAYDVLKKARQASSGGIIFVVLSSIFYGH